MRKRKGTTRILASILCFAMFICSIDISVMEVQASNDTTIIDVTGLASGAETSHDCSKYLTSKYDSTQHWQQCTICGKIYGNKTNHSYTDNGWTRGTANDCNPNNVHKYSCGCGYSYTTTSGKKEHVLTHVQNLASYAAYDTCLECSQAYGTNHHYCIKEDGSRISCKNLGTCKICGYTYTNSYHHSYEYIYTAGDDVYCLSGGEYLCHVNYNYAVINSDGQLTSYVSLTVPSGYTFVSADNYSNDTNVKMQNSISISGTTWTNTQTINYNGHSENWANSRVGFYFKDKNGVGGVLFIRTNICPENTAPVISNISQTDISTSNGWATQKKITITGTENYCGSVKLTMKDSSGNVYLNNVSVPVSSNNWSYNFIPNIEADANGKTFTVTATDTIGNSSSKTFTVYKTDKKAPTVTSANATSTNWSTSKSYTTKATDTGVGGVKIAFNDTNAYVNATQSSTTFTRRFKFTGDVYGSTTAAIYYKDALGNETTKFIKIYNIDNTAPTITDVTGSAVEDEKVEFVVSANDNKDFGGTVGIKSGSGVSKYAISSNNTAPASGWQTSNKLYATSTGDYYIFTKDAVGNISKSYKVKAINLTIDFNDGKFNNSSTSKVMLGAICGSKTTHTFNIKPYYGGFKNNRISVNKGINNKLTKTDTNGIEYRFLGYSLNKNATVPDTQFDVYSLSRTENYTIRDNTTLYAVWEPVLQMTVQLSAPQHSGVMQLTSDVPVTTTLGNFKIPSGTRSTDIPSSATASVNSATIGVNVTNEDLVSYTVSAKGASSIKFSTAADSRILDIYNHGKNNPWFDNLNEVKDFNYSIDEFSSTIGSFTIPQYLGTTQSYQTSNPDLASGTAVYGIKFTCTQPSYYYSKYWNSPESTSVYGILFLNPTLPDDNTNVLPPYAVEDGAYEFETILN